MKAIEIKRKSSKSAARVSLPEYVYRPIEALSDALGCRESEVIVQLASHRPGSELELVGKGGFTISLNVPLIELTKEQIAAIHEARLGDESAEETLSQTDAPAEAKVSVSEAKPSETAKPAQSAEPKVTSEEAKEGEGEAPRASTMAASILDELGEGFSDDEE